MPAGTWAYRSELRGIAGISLRLMVPVTFAGGAVGAVLLLVTPGAAFDVVVPWLLLLATVTFAAGPRPGLWLRQRIQISRSTLLAVQFILAIYGGYFGGAIGLMMMAVWTLIDASSLKVLAGSRTLLVSTANGAAVICFLAAGVVRLPEMLAMMLSAIVGGYFGARLALYPAGTHSAGIHRRTKRRRDGRLLSAYVSTSRDNAQRENTCWIAADRITMGRTGLRWKRRPRAVTLGRRVAIREPPGLTQPC